MGMNTIRSGFGAADAAAAGLAVSPAEHPFAQHEPSLLFRPASDASA